MNYPMIIVVILLVVGGNVLAGWQQRQELIEIRSRMNSEHALMDRALASKVDTKTREAMLSDLNHRLDRLDAQVDVLMDNRRENLARNKNISFDRRAAYAGIDCPNLSGTGSPAAIAYQRQRRDRLRLRSLNLSGIPWEP